MNDIITADHASYSREQLDLIKRTYAAGTSDDEFALFIRTTQRLGLDIFARQALCVRRWDSQKEAYVAQTQISIDGFRVIAERSGSYEGQTAPQWCGADGVWHDVWLSSSEPPSAARVGVFRKGWREPLYAVARWGAYVQLAKGGAPTRMWATMGDVMLAKCAESQALRKAFPHDLSGLYTPDEMGQAEVVDESTTPTATGHATGHALPSGRMGEALSKCALGEEEKARAAAQAEVARELADKLINDFKLTVAVAEERGDEDEPVSVVDAARDWIAANAGAADKLGEVERKRIAKTLYAYVDSGVIDGMNGAGFQDEWKAAVMASRPKRR